eukprot:SM000097S24796  [mRNA]  locus=s97:299684:300884:+ [translate_table: standard]
MEDAHVQVDNMGAVLGAAAAAVSAPTAFYGVFDGHGGREAAAFACERLLGCLVEDPAFPGGSVAEALTRAFARTDDAFRQVCLTEHHAHSGTTALAAIILGSSLFVANVGDCRAVLSRRGRAVELSRDQKASCALERARIESFGGYVDLEGYLNGQLLVARALGNWHLQGLKARAGAAAAAPLTAVPEVREAALTVDDEFLLLGCDGLWDVFSSQNAVDFARRRLQAHNDPQQAAQELVDEALHRQSTDNLTVLAVCFAAGPPPRLGCESPARARSAAEALRGSNGGVKRSISADRLRSLQELLDRS